MLRTYQTKINPLETEYLNEVASFLGMIKRKLFVDIGIRNRKRNECKKEYISKYAITARQFNALFNDIDGTIKSFLERIPVYIEETKDKINSTKQDIEKKMNTKINIQQRIMDMKNKNSQDKKIEKLRKKYKNIKFKIHQKKRKLYRLELKLEKLLKDQEEKRIRICFGSKKLFSKQFNLEENKYKDHNDWKEEWIKARNSYIYCIGSKDETCGNQTCQYNSSTNELKLRVINQSIKKYGKYLIFTDITFPYGQKDINKALETYIGVTSGNKKQKYCMSAISYQFIRKEKGWYLHATTDIKTPTIKTSKECGCIGVDLNAGFISLCHVDRFGNPTMEKKINMNLYNRSSEQVKATIGDVVKKVIDDSIKYNTPISIEKLNFSKKKRTLKEESKEYARMLSGFAYKQFNVMLKSRAERLGVEVIEVNPAYTSIIGQFKFMKRYGLSSHGSAACVIGRRGLGFKIEKIPYINPLGNFRFLISKKRLYNRWSTLSFIVKKGLKYSERIQMLLGAN